MKQDDYRGPDWWLYTVARGAGYLRLASLLIVIGFFALAGYLGSAKANKDVPFIACGVMMGLLVRGTLGYVLLRDRGTSPEGEVNAGRRVVLVSGGLAGFFTFVLGLTLLYVWWDDVFAGGLEKWRANV